MSKIIKKQDIANYVNYQAEPTKWFKVTQSQINAFADCTLDRQFIHVDPVAASKTPFGTTIAHGFLTLSMLAHFAEEFCVLIEGCYMGLNSGFDKVRFLQPVKEGSRIRACATIKSITETKPNQFRINTKVVIEIENCTSPALVAQWISVQQVKE